MKVSRIAPFQLSDKINQFDEFVAEPIDQPSSQLASTHYANSTAYATPFAVSNPDTTKAKLNPSSSAKNLLNHDRQESVTHLNGTDSTIIVNKSLLNQSQNQIQDQGENNNNNLSAIQEASIIYKKRNSIESAHNSIISSPTCRVCLVSLKDEGHNSLSQAKLMSLCKCRGSIQYIHFNCIKASLESQFGKTPEMANSLQITTDSSEKRRQRIKRSCTRQHSCELCNEQYEVKWKSSTIKRSLETIKAKKKCYLALSIICLILLIGCIYGTTRFAMQNASESSVDVGDTMMSLMGMILLALAGIIAFAMVIVFTYKTLWVKIYVIRSIGLTDA